MKPKTRLIVISMAVVAYILAVAVVNVCADPATYSKIYLKSGEDIHEIANVPRIDGEMQGEYTLMLPLQTVAGVTLQYGTFFFCSLAGNDYGESVMVCTDVESNKCPKTSTTVKEGPGPHIIRWSYDGYVTEDACDDPTITWPPFVISNEEPTTPIFPGCMRRVGTPGP